MVWWYLYKYNYELLLYWQAMIFQGHLTDLSKLSTVYSRVYSKYLHMIKQYERDNEAKTLNRTMLYAYIA